MPEQKIKIGFTIGDVNGIGPEVIIRSLEDKRILNHCTPIIYGSNRILSFYKKLLNAEHFNYTTCPSADAALPKNINVVNCIQEEAMIQPGIETTVAGKYAQLSLEAATAELRAGKINAVVTAPINKHAMQQAGFQFTGHTEYFTHEAGVKDSVMLLISEQMKVGLITNHLAVKDVAPALNKELILKKIEILHQSLLEDFTQFKPRIAVLALNPHSGDNGLLGQEEQNIILPAIREAQEKKMMVIGPFSADGFFGSGNYNSFDAVLAIYHDQGLVPFKALSFGNGVNYTAGLSFVRTSPDHGTAYDIAGKNVASPESMLQAIFTAVDICKNRTSYRESIQNPLKKTVMSDE